MEREKKPKEPEMRFRLVARRALDMFMYLFKGKISQELMDAITSTSSQQSSDDTTSHTLLNDVTVQSVHQSDSFFRNEDENSYMISKGKLYRFVDEDEVIETQKRSAKKAISPLPTMTKAQFHKYLAKIQSHVADVANIRALRKLDEFSATIGIEAQDIRTVLYYEYTKDFHRWKDGLKVDLIKNYLRGNPNASIDELREYAGFGSNSAMFIAFKRESGGVSIGVWRRRYITNKDGDDNIVDGYPVTA